MTNKTTQEVYRERATIGADLSAKLYDADADERLFLIPDLTTVQIDCLEQLWRGHRADGDVYSKQGRDDLTSLGLAERWNGWNFITKAGVAVLDMLNGRGGLERKLKTVTR